MDYTLLLDCASKEDKHMMCDNPKYEFIRTFETRTPEKTDGRLKARTGRKPSSSLLRNLKFTAIRLTSPAVKTLVPLNTLLLVSLIKQKREQEIKKEKERKILVKLLKTERQQD